MLNPYSLCTKTSISNITFHIKSYLPHQTLPSISDITLILTTTMGAVFIACYPRPADGKSYRFDLEYYVNVHMPMQLKYHGPYGLRSYHVIEPTEDAPYVIQTVEFWDSLDSMEKGIAEASAELYEDIPNYTDIPNAFPIRAKLKASYPEQKKD